MGDPKKSRKKYKRPKKLWDKRRIEEESALKSKYGLKNMRELWIAATLLRKFRTVARKLLAMPKEVQEREGGKILRKLNRYGILPENATLDDVLSLSVEEILERRLQTLVYKKGMARTLKQARQLIVHGFISVNGVRVRSPGMLLTVDEEKTISYYKPINLNPKTQEELNKSDEESAQGNVNENVEENVQEG